jgi:hypothetical protein
MAQAAGPALALTAIGHEINSAHGVFDGCCAISAKARQVGDGGEGPHKEGQGFQSLVHVRWNQCLLPGPSQSQPCVSKCKSSFLTYGRLNAARRPTIHNLWIKGTQHIICWDTGPRSHGSEAWAHKQTKKR